MPDVEQIMVAEGDDLSPGTEDVKLEDVEQDGSGGFDPSSLSVSTNTPADADEIVTGESGTWFRKAFSKIWDYIKTKIGISSQGSTGKYLNEQGNFTTPPDTTYNVVSTTENGLAPMVTDVDGYLKGDGTWSIPPDTTYNVVSTTENGLAPKITNTSGYLKGDGTWSEVPVYDGTNAGLVPAGGSANYMLLGGDGTWHDFDQQKLWFSSSDVSSDSSATSWLSMSQMASADTMTNLMEILSKAVYNVRYLKNYKCSAPSLYYDGQYSPSTSSISPAGTWVSIKSLSFPSGTHILTVSAVISIAAGGVATMRLRLSTESNNLYRGSCPGTSAGSPSITVTRAFTLTSTTTMYFEVWASTPCTAGNISVNDLRFT